MIGKDVFPLHQPAADELSQGDVVPPQLFRQQTRCRGLPGKGKFTSPLTPESRMFVRHSM